MVQITLWTPRKHHIHPPINCHPPLEHEWISHLSGEGVAVETTASEQIQTTNKHRNYEYFEL